MYKLCLWFQRTRSASQAFLGNSIYFVKAISVFDLKEWPDSDMGRWSLGTACDVGRWGNMYIRVGLGDWPFHSSIEPQPLLFHCFLQSLYVRERTSQVSELLLKTAEKCAQGMKVLSPHNPHQYPSDRLRSSLLGQRQSVPFSLSRNMH